MHPDSIIVDFEKDENGNISSCVVSTIVNGEVFCFNVPYNSIILPVAVLLETVRDIEYRKESIFHEQVQKEIQEIIR